MEIIKRTPRTDPHPHIPELKSMFRNGRLTRREFLWNSTMLGLSATAAYAFTGLVDPAKAGAAAVQRGGVYKLAHQMQNIDHPARLSWLDAANLVRQVAEFLTDGGPDNITRPWLCEKWVASEDLKTWDLHLRKGVTFNNGQAFTADDVIFTMKEWLNPDVGSSMLGLLSYVGGAQNIEKVNDHLVRMHLETPNIGVPEHLFHYPGMIVPHTFEGDFIKQPIGTGPFTLEEYVDGERARFKRRSDYWKLGADGQPLPYLDEILFVSMDKDAGLAAMLAGQVDTLYKPRPSDLEALKNYPDITVRTVGTANTYVIRMRVDIAPWDDVRVRSALKKCLDRPRTLELAGNNYGDLAIDAHVAPIHPAYCEKPIPEYDPQGARALLEQYAKEKGLDLPLKVRLATKNNEAEPDIAQTLAERARAGGFDITLDITEPSGYWDRWTEVDFGVTSWGHRPLATMVLALAYTKEAIGAWNETRWTDDEFAALLTKAEGTLDVEKRRQLMCRIEDIMQEKGPAGITYWRASLNTTHKRFHGIDLHPSNFLIYPRQMWREA